jgi:hypothetical protein
MQQLHTGLAGANIYLRNRMSSILRRHGVPSFAFVRRGQWQRGYQHGHPVATSNTCLNTHTRPAGVVRAVTTLLPSVYNEHRHTYTSRLDGHSSPLCNARMLHPLGCHRPQLVHQLHTVVGCGSRHLPVRRQTAQLQYLRTRGMCVSSTESKLHQDKSVIVTTLNTALDRYPLTTSLLYLYHNAVLVGVCAGVMGLTHLHVPDMTAMALAFVIHASTTTLRIPLASGLAAILAKSVPSITGASPTLQIERSFQQVNVRDCVSKGTNTLAFSAGVRISQMIKLPIAWMLGKHQVQPASHHSSPSSAFHSHTASPSPSSPTAASQPEDSAHRSLSSRVFNWFALGDVLDKYGLAYVFAGRIVATVSLGAMYTGVAYAYAHGHDVTSVTQGLHSYVPTLAEWLDGVITKAQNSVATPVSDAASLLSADLPPPPASLWERVKNVASSWHLFDSAAATTMYWAQGCIAVNLVYPLVLHCAVSKLSLKAGPTTEPFFRNLGADESGSDDAARRSATGTGTSASTRTATRP